MILPFLAGQGLGEGFLQSRIANLQSEIENDRTPGSARNRLTPARVCICWQAMRRGKAPDAILRLVDTFDRNVAVTDRQIDELVYDLYGLMDKEIGIVEGRIND